MKLNLFRNSIISVTIGLVFSGVIFFSCSKKEATVTPVEVTKEVVTVETYDDTNFVAKDWTVESHSNKGTPNFDLIFNDQKVQRIDLVIPKNRWQTMLKDMTTLYGAFGATGMTQEED